MRAPDGTTPMRRWCALICYPSKKPVMYGTLFARPDAPLEEIRAAMISDILERLPEGFEIVNLLPGAIWFQPEE